MPTSEDGLVPTNQPTSVRSVIPPSSGLPLSIDSSTGASVRRTSGCPTCAVPGCHKTVKSQGVCQSHGARVKICEVSGCTKQARGGCSGLCQNHWNQRPRRSGTEVTGQIEVQSQEDTALTFSTCKDILPSSYRWRKNRDRNSARVMPLVSFLGDKDGKAEGWHRDEERASRGLSRAGRRSHFLPWEKQMVVTETLLLAGASDANGVYRDLAWAWGRKQGFHQDLVAQFFERGCSF